MCSARSTDSHVSRIREPSQKHPGQCVAQHLGISWPSQDHSTITHYRGLGGSAAPGAQPGERRRRARGSSDSAAPKHRRRRRSRESRVSAAGLLAPSGAASERRSGSLGFSAVHSLRCAAVLHLSENVPWAQRRHATAVARPGPLDVGRRVSVPCLCWLEVPFSPWLRAGRGAQLHTPSSLSVYGRVGRVRPALCPSATSPRALLLEDARAVSSDYPGGRSSPRPADL